MATVFIVTCYASKHENTPAEESAWRDIWLYVRSTPSGVVVDRLFLRNACAYLHCAILCIFCGLIPVMLCTQLELLVDNTRVVDVQNASILNSTNLNASSVMNSRNVTSDVSHPQQASFVGRTGTSVCCYDGGSCPLFRWKVSPFHFVILNMLTWLPAISTAALLAAKLEGRDISMAFVFLPFWIISVVVLHRNYHRNSCW